MASHARVTRAHRRAAARKGTASTAESRIRVLQPAQALAIPLAFTIGLAAFALLPSVQSVATLRWSFWGAAGLLAVWAAVLFVQAARRDRAFALEISLRKQHYLQACAHFSIFVYWGAYWDRVPEAAPLIAAQLLFAYAFDALLSWSRRDTYTVGFGPFPIVFSTNLFLWFKPEWFYLQFLMVGLGFAAKEFLRWTRDGRRIHIFNPSSFPLSVCSIVLILMGATRVTWGPEIAMTQLNPPHIYLWIFLVSIPAQLLFGVASMTLAAVGTTYAFIAVHDAMAGTHFFTSPTIPIAVFLGMHLLFTDPSTSPRTELGRLIFGMLYGGSVVALYAVLDRLGVPTFYDKLLPVPILNLMVPAIDRAMRSDLLKRFDPGTVFRVASPQAHNVVYTSVWVVMFLILQTLTGNAVTLARADALVTQGRMDEAIGQYRELVQSDPSRFEGHNKLGFALLQVGRPQEALASIQRAVELQPHNPEAHNNLGLALMQAGRHDEAVASLERAVQLKPDYAEARYNLGHALTTVDRSSAAVDEFRQALRVRPDWTPALASLAWIEATADDGLRDPADAVRLASHAADLTSRKDAQVLDVLAAAYASAGRFDEATRTAEAAEQIATSTSSDLAAQIQMRLNLYRSRRPLQTSPR